MVFDELTADLFDIAKKVCHFSLLLLTLRKEKHIIENESKQSLKQCFESRLFRKGETK